MFDFSCPLFCLFCGYGFSFWLPSFPFPYPLLISLELEMIPWQSMHGEFFLYDVWKHARISLMY